MTRIPAICLTPGCNTIFPSIFNLTAQNVSFQNIGMGPCPKCGGGGKIPDGTYSVLGDNLFALLEDINDFAVFHKIVATLKRDLKRNKSPKNIKKTLSKRYPKHRSAWNLIPETKQDAYAVINIILAIIMTVIAIGSCTKENRDIIINQTINNLYLQEPSRVEPGNPFGSETENTVSQNRPVKI